MKADLINTGAKRAVGTMFSQIESDVGGGEEGVRGRGRWRASATRPRKQSLMLLSYLVLGVHVPILCQTFNAILVQKSFEYCSNSSVAFPLTV